MLPRVQWLELISGNRNAALLACGTRADGNIADHELEILCHLVQAVNPRLLFEIGTFDGRTALNLAANSAPDARIYTLDLPSDSLAESKYPLELAEVKYIAKPASGMRYRGTDVAYKITQLYGDSATFNFRPYFGKADFVFIDGSHSYPYVMSDSWNALRMARPGSWIVWHDYVLMGTRCWPGVAQALEELRTTSSAFGNLRHIADTDLAVLKVDTSWYRRLLTPLGHARLRWRRRSKLCWHTGACAALQVRLQENRVTAGTPITVQVRAKNIGRVVWLPNCPGLGAVNLGCHLLDPTGARLDDDFWHHAFSSTDAVLPGQTVEMAAQLPAPPPGCYILEFDLVAEGVCWFAQNGSAKVRRQVEVI